MSIRQVSKISISQNMKLQNKHEGITLYKCLKFWWTINSMFQ